MVSVPMSHMSIHRDTTSTTDHTPVGILVMQPMHSVMAGCRHPLTDHWHLLVPDPLDPLEDALCLLKTPPICDGVDHDETVALCHVLCGEVINNLT